MECLEYNLREAIGLIDRFLDDTKDPGRSLAAARFQELSCRIESTQWARDFQNRSTRASLAYLDLCSTYRRRLECLLKRLVELEVCLTEERGRLTEECARIFRAREWHDAMSNTQ